MIFFLCKPSGDRFDRGGEVKVPLVGVAVAGVQALAFNPVCNFLYFGSCNTIDINH